MKIDLSAYPVTCPVKWSVGERAGEFPAAVPYPEEPWMGRMPWWDYHQLRAVRSGDLRVAAERSLAHMRWARDNEDDEQAAAVMTTGRAFHASLLEPETEWKKFARAPDWLTNRTRKADKEEWARLVEEHGKDFVLRAPDYDAVVGQGRAVMARPTYAGLLREGERELAVVWRDQATGVWCKARLDFITVIMDRITVLDLKGTRDARPDPFSRSINEFGYHYQGAQYLAGLSAHGIAATDYCLMASEWAPPHGCRLYRMSDHLLALAEMKRDAVLARIAEAERTGVWPAYDEDVQVIGILSWAQRDLEAELQREEAR